MAAVWRPVRDRAVIITVRLKEKVPTNAIMTITRATYGVRRA